MNNKGEISRTIIKGLFLAGVIIIASTSPRFAQNILDEIFKSADKKYSDDKKYRKSSQAAFSRFLKNGLVKIEYRGNQMHISLTKEGLKKAGKYQINDMQIKKPKKWDRKWRLLIFDIPNEKGINREALRGKAKELGLHQLQKSVWIHPFDFLGEFKLLKDFFGLKDEECTYIVTEYMANDRRLRNDFNL